MLFKVKIMLLAGLLALIPGVLPGYAQSEATTFEGQVIETAPETFQIVMETTSGEVVRVFVPESFDFTSIASGDTIRVTGQLQEDGSVQAQTVELVTPGEDDTAPADSDTTVTGPEEGEQDGKQNSAFCADDKQDQPHPFSTILAERFGVTEAWVMDYFCDGVGMGQIMLALLTQEKSTETTAEEVLAARSGGSGWGQIWKVLGLIGPERTADGPPGLADKENGRPDSPPGLQNRPDHAGKKNKPGK